MFRENTEDKGEMGRTAEGATGDISTPQGQEGQERSLHERFADIKKGIEAIMAKDPGFSYGDMLGREGFLAGELVEEGILRAQDIEFEGTMQDIKKAARMVSIEGLENAGRDKGFKKTA